MTIRINPRRVVRCDAALHIPLSGVCVWGQLRDFCRYAQQDFFHADIHIDGGVPRAGAALQLCHRYSGVRIERRGRILLWREGVGYSFSDLSHRGPRSGFPHVFSYRLQSLGEGTCRLHINVRGLWTARHLPRWCAWLWLWWVFSHIVRNIRRELLVYQVWRQVNAAARSSTGRSTSPCRPGTAQ
jgi:hypothetical protein